MLNYVRDCDFCEEPIWEGNGTIWTEKEVFHETCFGEWAYKKLVKQHRNICKEDHLVD